MPCRPRCTDQLFELLRETGKPIGVTESGWPGDPYELFGTLFAGSEASQDRFFKLLFATLDRYPHPVEFVVNFRIRDGDQGWERQRQLSLLQPPLVSPLFVEFYKVLPRHRALRRRRGGTTGHGPLAHAVSAATAAQAVAVRARHLLIILAIAGAGELSASGAQLSAGRLSVSPPMGWTSWTSLLGAVHEEAVTANAREQAASLKAAGYVYVNVDAGWYLDPDRGVDAHGRWLADPARFPSGMAALGDYLHGLGLKFGIYVTPGIPATAVRLDLPIEGTPHRASDIAITTRIQTTYLGGTMYYIDYSHPAGQSFVDSWAAQFASWGVDYVKIDGVGDGNVPDVLAWSTALRRTGRAIHVALSNDLSRSGAVAWRALAGGWRISPDIEAYNGTTLTDWPHVLARFIIAPWWLGTAGAGGWNDFDSLVVGSPATGLSAAERASKATFWALSASPLIVGDDLRTLDPLGRSLLTNPEVIAVNQAGAVASPLSTATPAQIWAAPEVDGSYAVGLFNLGESPATASASWASLGFSGPAEVRDLRARADLGTYDEVFDVGLAAHESMLLRVTPSRPALRLPAAEGETTGWAMLGESLVAQRGLIAQFVGLGSTLTFRQVEVAQGGTYHLTLNVVNGDRTPRDAVIAVNGAVSRLSFPGVGGWGTAAAIQGLTTAVQLAQGRNEIVVSNPDAWAPDIVGVSLQPVSPGNPAAYQIVSLPTGRLLDGIFAGSDAGQPVIQWPASGSPSQHWRLATYTDGTAALINRATGLALAAEDEPGRTDSVLTVAVPDGSSRQRWRAVATGWGAYVLVNTATGLVAHASTGNGGARVDQVSHTGAIEEQWIVIPVI